jgi:hypothetical protein
MFVAFYAELSPLNGPHRGLLLESTLVRDRFYRLLPVPSPRLRQCRESVKLMHRKRSTVRRAMSDRCRDHLAV